VARNVFSWSAIFTVLFMFCYIGVGCKQCCSSYRPVLITHIYSLHTQNAPAADVRRWRSAPHNGPNRFNTLHDDMQFPKRCVCVTKTGRWIICSSCYCYCRHVYAVLGNVWRWDKAPEMWYSGNFIELFTVFP
jgi:hypothetical protein